MTMNEKQIQLTTYNQFGEFNFYVDREEIQAYLDSKFSEINVDHFLEESTLNDARMLFDWIKENSVKKATE